MPDAKTLIEKRPLDFIERVEAVRPVNDDYVDHLADLIDRVGFQPHPLQVTPDGTLFNGNHRYVALQLLDADEALMHIHDPRTNGADSLHAAAIAANEADSDGLPMTFVDYAELIWHKLESATQQKVADELGWGRSTVAGYARLSKIADEAWEIVAASTRNELLRNGGGETRNVADATFGEYLLRKIVSLTDRQQYGLVSALAEGHIDKSRFKQKARKLKARNAARQHVASELSGVDDEFLASALEEVDAGEYDTEWIENEGPGDSLRTLIRHTRDEHREASLTTLIHADFREAGSRVEDESVDLIFTDPPYDAKTVPLYGDLAEFGARVLKPGGSLLCYAGHYAIPDILDVMTPHLRYWWMCAVTHSGGNRSMPGKFVHVGFKPVLWFVKGKRRTSNFVADRVSGGLEKDDHEWQQAESESAYYIDKLTRKGQTVADPFLGSGTTGVAAKKAGRQFVGFEIEEDTIKAARRRIANA